MIVDRCAIVGVGLIGGSLGLALNERELVGHITGVDINRENLSMALKAGAVHEVAELTEAVRGADLVILATQVGQTANLLKQIKPLLKPEAVVTDVGSTKKMVVAEAEKILGGGRFVGGHPMTGAETAGFAGADPYIFENAFYLLTPTSETDGFAVELIERLVRAMGALVLKTPPEEHDLMVAAISHLPHFVAFTLVAAISGLPAGEKALALAAGGFRDTTRIAASSPEMWRDIFLSNREQVLELLENYCAAFNQLKETLIKNDSDRLLSILNEVSKTRKNLTVRPKGYLPYVYEIVVTVPDRPGVIAMLASLLGKDGINISEIEILRVREGYGGTIKIGFATQDEQKRAMLVLGKNSIKCRVKY